MTILSQRDPRWASQKLGFHPTFTIGSHGCFITSIAMIVGTTPDVVNDRLRAVSGYMSKSGVLIWSKVPEALKGVTIKHLLEPYNNDIVRANLPVLVTVDGTPIGAPLHAVVYIGNQQLADPWTGIKEPTSKYKAQKFVVLQGQYKPVDPLQECLRFHEERVIEVTKLKETIQKLQLEKDTAMQQAEQRLATELAKVRSECEIKIQDRINNFKQKISIEIQSLIAKSSYGSS